MSKDGRQFIQFRSSHFTVHTTAIEATVRHRNMAMGVEHPKFAEGLDDNNRTQKKAVGADIDSLRRGNHAAAW